MCGLDGSSEKKKREVNGAKNEAHNGTLENVTKP